MGKTVRRNYRKMNGSNAKRNANRNSKRNTKRNTKRSNRYVGGTKYPITRGFLKFIEDHLNKSVDRAKLHSTFADMRPHLSIDGKGELTNTKSLILEHIIDYTSPHLDNYVILLEHNKNVRKLDIDDTLKVVCSIVLVNAIKSHSVHLEWIENCKTCLANMDKIVKNEFSLHRAQHNPYGAGYFALETVVRYFKIELKNTIAIEDVEQAREEPLRTMRTDVEYHLGALK